MQEHQFANAEDARNFILGGNAYFTLRSLKSGTRYTFRVKKAPDRNVYWVSTLYGGNNEGDYAYVGIIQEGQFRLTGKSRFNEQSPQAQAFGWAWAFMKDNGRVPTTLEVWHEGRCGCCGRRLTVPESLIRGIGPECAKRVLDPNAQQTQRVSGVRPTARR